MRLVPDSPDLKVKAVKSAPETEEAAATKFQEDNIAME
jgi:hypothetical protein